MQKISIFITMLVAFILTPKFCYGDDDFLSAILIDPYDSSTEASIDFMGDIDFFKFNLTQPGTVTISTTGDINTFGELLNESGEFITNDSYGGTGENFSITENLNAGTYFVKIKGYENNITGSYTLVSEWNVDGNDDLSSAILINPYDSSAIDGNIDFSGDVDFFKFNLTQSGTVTIRTTGDTNTFGILLNELGEVITDSYGDTDDNFSISTNLNAGTYFVKVKGYRDNITGSYTLVSEVNADGNDDISSAILIDPYGSTTEGNIDVEGDIDFFKFNLTQSGTVTISTTGDTYFSGILLNELGEPITTSDNGGTDINFSTFEEYLKYFFGEPITNSDNGTDINFSTSKYLNAGTYFVKVKGDRDYFTGSYTLILELVVDGLPFLVKGIAVDGDKQIIDTKRDVIFFGGSAVNDETFQTTNTMHISEEVIITGTFMVDSIHQNQSADIIIVASYTPLDESAEEQFFMIDKDNNLISWDMNRNKLVAAIENVNLQKKQQVDLYPAKSVGIGQNRELRIFFGYRLNNGTIVFNGEQPIRLTVFKGPAGTLQFSSNVYRINEEKVVLFVTRSGSSEGEISVNYLADSPSSFENLFGYEPNRTLIWKNGDTTPKAITTTTFFNDSSNHDGYSEEVVEFKLFDVTGGATLGIPDELQISHYFPPFACLFCLAAHREVHTEVNSTLDHPSGFLSEVNITEVNITEVNIALSFSSQPLSIPVKQLHIPVVAVSGKGNFSANLFERVPTVFTVENATPTQSNPPDNTNLDVESGLLHLPRMSDEDGKCYQTDMQYIINSDPLQFQLEKKQPVACF
jgi:hypothetical protein